VPGIRWFAIVLSVGVLVGTPLVASAQRSLATAPAPAAHQALSSDEPHFIYSTGVAFGAFHRYLWTPFKDGKLGPCSDFQCRLVVANALGKAIEPFDAAVCQLVDAYRVAKRVPALSVLLAPLRAIVEKLSSMRGGIYLISPFTKREDEKMHVLESSITSFEKEAKRAGATIDETILPANVRVGTFLVHGCLGPPDKALAEA
jgi:hypothetical protein